MTMTAVTKEMKMIQSGERFKDEYRRARKAKTISKLDLKLWARRCGAQWNWMGQVVICAMLQGLGIGTLRVKEGD